MIKNERQYRIMKSWVQRFMQTLTRLGHSLEESEHLHPLLRKAERDALAGQIETCSKSCRNMRHCRAVKNAPSSLTFLIASPDARTKAHIAAGLSQKELAGRLGLKRTANPSGMRRRNMRRPAWSG